MLMAEPSEGPLDLLIDESDRRIEGDDAAGQLPPSTEMSRAEGHLLAETDRARRASGDGTLTRAGPHR